MTYKLSQILENLTIDFTGNDIDIDGIHTLSEATHHHNSLFLPMQSMLHNSHKLEQQQFL